MLREVSSCALRCVRRCRKGLGWPVLPLLVVLVAGWAVNGQTGEETDIAVVSLHIGWVEQEASQDRSLGLDQALVGDTVRVSATVRNVGKAAVGQFEVDFFFTETISGEHGKIGTQTVSGLDVGEESRPVVSVDTTAFTPGVYVFSAEADADGSLGEEEANRCNNVAPLGACAGAEEERADRYRLTLLRSGRHISEMTLADAFPVCRMGSLQTSLAVDVHNVGTESLTSADLEVWGYYRLALEPPADEFDFLVKDAEGNPVQLSKFASPGDPGDEGFILVTLNYDIFNRLFQPSAAAAESGDVLGKANPVQLRISVNPEGGGSPKDVFLPEPFNLAQFYSTVDLWTFPARTHCRCDDYTDIESVHVAPVVSGGLVFHVASTASGDRLHVLKVRTGEEKASWAPAGGGSLTSPAVSYDAPTQTYRVYVGAGDGRVYALEGEDKEDEPFLVELWQSDDGLGTGFDTTSESPTTHLVLSDDGSKLVVGSGHGVFVLDTVAGGTERSHTRHGAVTTAPAYVDGTGTIWIAADEVVYGIRSNGSSCSFDAQDRITTSLGLNATRTTLFFGAESGGFYALDATSSGSTCSEKAFDGITLRSIVGMSLVSTDDDAVIYLTSDIGEIARFEYDEGRGFDDVELSERQFDPTDILTAPAVLPNSDGDDAVAVFISGWTRDGRVTRPILQGWESDLEEYESITAWSSSVPFLFKPEENGAIPDALLRPVVDTETGVLLVASSDGYLYAFDLSPFQ